MKLFLLLLTLIAAPAFAQTVGFSQGNNLQVATYEGIADLECGGLPHTTFCDTLEASPGFYDVVVTSTSVDADHVTLVATHDGGKQAEKTNINFKNGKSDQINLLISTLFQRPLLAIGQNKIDYTFKKGGATVLTGTFQVAVVLKGHFGCPTLPVMGFGPMCQDENNSQVCNDYFDRLDTSSCQPE